MSEMKNPEEGKLIVIEGTDGSGKKTQADLLAKRFVQESIEFEMADFPQYKTPSAYFVEKYLRGEYGGLDVVGPRMASYFYALDRYDASQRMRKCLSEGRHIVCNRYTTSSMAHQTAQIDSADERKAFLDWLDRMEHEDLMIPRPDLVIFLNVPAAIGQDNVANKGEREYTGGKTHDLLEGDLDHLTRASLAYREIAQKYGWVQIDCVRDGKMMIPDEIHGLVYRAVEDFLK